jgi:hypothetical protein
VLTLTELASLQKALRQQDVLTVYVSAPTVNPALRHAWRTTLDAKLRRWDRDLAVRDKKEHQRFALAREALDQRLASAVEEQHAPGLAAFVTVEGVQCLEPLPFAVETVVVWGRGIAAAPYVRAFKQERPVVLAVVDGKTAQLYRYQFARLRPLEEIRVEPQIEEPAHMGAAPGRSFHSGTRGSTGHDDAQRGWAAATNRMVHRLVGHIAHYCGDDGWVLIGGRADTVRHVIQALPASVQERAGVVHGVSMKSATHELASEVRSGASRLRNVADLRALAELSRSAGAREAAAVGESESRRALEDACVAQLFISSRYLREHAEHAEAAVQSALEQGAWIETVSDDAGERLDAMGGIAARLRYAVRPARKTADGAAPFCPAES